MRRLFAVFVKVLVSFFVFVATSSMQGCTHRVELRQEIVAANELLPAPSCAGLTARSVALEDDVVVYRIEADEAVVGCVGCDKATCWQRLETLLHSAWYGDRNAPLRHRLATAGCGVRYEVRLNGSGTTFSIAIANDSLE